MRLLNKALEFAEFHDEDTTPHYLILSHTWGKEEVIYQDLLKWQENAIINTVDGEFKVRQSIEKMAGFQKIRQMAKFVSRHETVKYFWIDTCCIDKRSSAELSESINSMFRWYKNAFSCITWFEDVEIPQGIDHAGWNHDQFRVLLRNCRWFTRGWTLQELIASKEINFYDKNWKLIHHKAKLAKAISLITGIPEYVLIYCDLSSCSTAKRFSWASTRKTTR